jgi:hypothetical protein
MVENVLTPEDIAQMQKDIEDAKSRLVSKDTQAVIDKAKEETRAQVTQELESKKAQEDKDRIITELKAKVESQEKEAASRFDMLQKKLDEMSQSKVVIPPQDPFANQTKPAVDIDKWSDEQVRQFEENSARKFFGEDFDK